MTKMVIKAGFVGIKNTQKSDVHLHGVDPAGTPDRKKNGMQAKVTFPPGFHVVKKEVWDDVLKNPMTARFLKAGILVVETEEEAQKETETEDKIEE